MSDNSSSDHQSTRSRLVPDLTGMSVVEVATILEKALRAEAEAEDRVTDLEAALFELARQHPGRARKVQEELGKISSIEGIMNEVTLLIEEIADELKESGDDGILVGAGVEDTVPEPAERERPKGMKQVRRWARQQGIHVGEKGRLPVGLLKAYKRANPESEV